MGTGIRELDALRHGGLRLMVLEIPPSLLDRFKLTRLMDLGYRSILDHLL